MPPRHPKTYDVLQMDAAQIDVLLGDWKFAKDDHGDVRGYSMIDSRKTTLKTGKGDHTALQFAQNAALNGEWLCDQWPTCEHRNQNGEIDDTPEACIRARRAEDNKYTTRGMRYHR